MRQSMETQGKLSARHPFCFLCFVHGQRFTPCLSIFPPPMHTTQSISERNDEPLPLLYCEWCSPGTCEASRVSAVVNLQGYDSANSDNEGEGRLLSMSRGTSRGSGAGDSENGDTVPESNADTVTRAPSPADSTPDLVSPLTSRLKPLWRDRKAYRHPSLSDRLSMLRGPEDIDKLEGSRNDSGSASRAFSTPSAARSETHKNHCLSCGQVARTPTLVVAIFQRFFFGYASAKAPCDDSAMSGRPILCSPCFVHSRRLTDCIPRARTHKAVDVSVLRRTIRIAALVL
jgi:hypothetical protein